MMPPMDNRLRNAVAVLAVGVTWAVLWAAIGIMVVLIIAVVDPAVIDPGEGPVDMVLILGPLGLSAGIVFGGLVSLLDRRRTIADTAWLPTLVLGILAAGIVGVAAGLTMGAISNSLVLGAVSAPASIAIARLVSQRRRPLRA